MPYLPDLMVDLRRLQVERVWHQEMGVGAELHPNTYPIPSIVGFKLRCKACGWTGTRLYQSREDADVIAAIFPSFRHLVSTVCNTPAPEPRKDDKK